MHFVKTKPGADPIIVEGYFSASPARLFQAFTDPELVMQWFGPRPNSLHSATIDLRQGGVWCFLEMHGEDKSTGFEGTYVDIVPEERLVFSWSRVTVYADGRRESTELSCVEVTFTANGSGTYMCVVHSAMESENTRKQFSQGWERGIKTLSATLSGYQQQ